jgi:DNA replication protein DnaC
MTTSNDHNFCKKHNLSKYLFSEKPFEVWFCDLCEKEFEEAEKKRAEIEEYEKIHAGIPLAFHKAELEATKTHETAYNWLISGSGFLFIHGATGCGKTHLSCALAKYCNKNKRHLRLEFASDLFMRIKKSYSDESAASEEYIINSLSPDGNQAHTVIFDDIAAQRVTDWTLEIWYNIIDRRYRNGQKTMFTSNLSIGEISKIMNDRIASRLASGIVHKMDGEDRRLKRV